MKQPDFSDKAVKEKFSAYPARIRKKLVELRTLIFEVAAESDDIEELVETLKWGEPSYLSKSGSTVRIDWKAAQPDQYAMYFNCNTKLVATFKEIYPNVFQYQGNRAIVFMLDKEVPTEELKHCVHLTLSYHRIKHLPMLGV